MILFVVTCIIFLDSMLTTCVVPILPELIYDIEHPTSTLRDTDSSFSIENQNHAGQTDGNPSISETHTALTDESLRVGIILASKSVVSLIINPVVGFWTERIGITIPLFVGFLMFFVSALLFGLANTYTMLLISRSIQGISSSCDNVSGMALIAEMYQGEQRTQAFSIVIGAMGIGFIAGPIYGGLMYATTGQLPQFIIMATFALFLGCLQLVVLPPKVQKSEKEPTSIMKLIMDPYIMLTAGAITIANTSFGVLDSTLSIRLIDKLHASRLQIGSIYITSVLGYMIASRISTYISKWIPKWLMAIIGLTLVGAFLILMIFTVSLITINIPNMGYGFATGLVDISMMPLFSYLVDIRHTGVYGNVYAIGDLSWAVSFAIGPVVGGALMKSIGFEWMLCFIALLNFLYAPLMLFLRNPPPKVRKMKFGENTPLLKEKLNEVNCTNNYLYS